MPDHISLSLVSHTNAGKTTLARTLLGRDVGEVRDAPHVTEFADAHTLVDTPEGDRLILWDTPGFGDSLRLVKRLRLSGNPIGWLLSQVWDRWRERPFWATQQALRNLRDEADVMLYLVNAAESPEAAGYVGPEMELLAWVGKPVIVLLNQLGAPREAPVEDAELARWRMHLAKHAQVGAVLPLDAFARCWVQEFALLRAIEDALDPARRPPMTRLRAAWRARRLATFHASMRVLAASLARTAGAREVVPDGSGLTQRLRTLGAALGIGAAGAAPAALAQQALAHQLDAEVRASTAELIALHGLEGRQGEVQREILARVASHYQVHQKLGEGKAAVWGGMVAGALTGLKADVLSGGLTLGGGLLAGGVLGALGAAGLARCYNLVRGSDASWLAWNGEALDAMAEAALLRYLAVAHFGRGRGEWAEAEAPPHWGAVVDAALAPRRAALAAQWAGRRVGARGDADDDDEQRCAASLEPLLCGAALAALEALYPGALEDAVPDGPRAPASGKVREAGARPAG